MSIKKNNSNQKSQRKITIENSKLRESHDSLYEDILNFILPKIKELFLTENEREFHQLDYSFRLRELVNWLLLNNIDLKREFEGSKSNLSNRAHTKSPMILKRVEILIKQGILKKLDKKVASKRNKDLKTDVFGFTEFGVLLALTMAVDNKSTNRSKFGLFNNSRDYKKMLAYLVKQWLIILPLLRYDYDNSNYYCLFLDKLLNKCTNSHDDVVYKFLKLLPNPFDKQNFDSGYEFEYNLFSINHFLNPSRGYIFHNFPDLRHKISYVFFKKIVKEDRLIDSSVNSDANSFRSLFYTTISDVSKYLNIEHIDDQSSSPDPSTIIIDKELLLKFQFKIDVQNEIEKDFARYSDHEAFLANEYLTRKSKGDYSELRKQAIELLYKESIDEMHYMYKVKELWEKLRNDYLSNPDVIVIMVKCKICEKRYPYPYYVQNDILEYATCTLCNETALSFYEYYPGLGSKTKKREKKLDMLYP